EKVPPWHLIIDWKIRGTYLFVGDCRWGRNPLRAFPSDVSPATSRRGKESPATSRRGKPQIVAGKALNVVVQLTVNLCIIHLLCCEMIGWLYEMVKGTICSQTAVHRCTLVNIYVVANNRMASDNHEIGDDEHTDVQDEICINSRVNVEDFDGYA
nr:hypothetical protein [Tanacetum cinerariifolium]